jgi:hypothetical protein
MTRLGHSDTTKFDPFIIKFQPIIFFLDHPLFSQTTYPFSNNLGIELNCLIAKIKGLKRKFENILRQN